MSAPKAQLSDLVMALEMDSPEIAMRFDRQGGKMVWIDATILRQVEDGDDEKFADLPDWEKDEVEIAKAIAADDGTRFIAPPDKFDFHEYRQMERFIGTVANGRGAEELWRAIKGKGAFRCFKDTLHRLGLQDQWYRYRDQAMNQFVIEWAKDHQVTFVDDEPERPLRTDRK